MPFARHRPSAPSVSLALLLASLAGCASHSKSEHAPAPRTESDPTRRPAAIAAGQRIEWSQLEPRLAEAAGAAVLEEAILDVAVEQELARAGKTADSIGLNTDAEREIVVLAVAEESQVTMDQAAGLIDELCRARGLGPRRYAAQLRRNAILRWLVRDSVKVTPEEISLARRLNYGARARLRVIVTRSEREAAQIRDTLAPLSGETLRAEFSRIAQQQSVHPSAPRSGDIGVLSAEDPSLPVPMQQSLAAAQPGTLTDLVVTGEGYMLAYVDAIFPQVTPPADTEIERRVRLRKERVAMDELSNRLIAGSNVTVFNESLRWSWDRRR